MPNTREIWWPAEDMPEVIDIFLALVSYDGDLATFEVCVQTTTRLPHNDTLRIAEMLRTPSANAIRSIMLVIYPFVKADELRCQVDIGWYYEHEN
jgi:hypothetical protein